MILARSSALAVAALLAGIGVASATTITTSASYGVGGTPQLTDWSQVLTVNPFNTALGTLTGVSITLDSSGAFSGAVKNTSATPQNFKVTEDVNLSGSSSNAGISAIIGTLTQDLVVTQTYTALGSGTSAAFGPFGPTSTASATSTNFAAFESGPISTTITTATGTTVIGGGGNITNNINTKAGATLTVVYTYTPAVVPPPVPEPASLMLVLAGMAGTLLLRRRSV